MAEKYVYMVALCGSAKFYIYRDEPELVFEGTSYIYEVPDYPDPSERIKAYIDAIVSCLNQRNPADPGTARIRLGKIGPI